MYDKKSLKAEEFINDGEILDTLKYADENKDNLAQFNDSQTACRLVA
jgi:2-iminoacetate synthase